jgi:hypothetical protein
LKVLQAQPRSGVARRHGRLEFVAAVGRHVQQRCRIVTALHGGLLVKVVAFDGVHRITSAAARSLGLSNP